MDTLTWNEAIDQAMVPTELDLIMENGTSILSRKSRLNNAQTEVTDYDLIRERAAMLYIEAHEGEDAQVSFADPERVNDNNRVTFRTAGKLRREYVTYSCFDKENPMQTKTVRGFLVGDKVIPLAGVSSINVEGDNSVVIL